MNPQNPCLHGSSYKCLKATHGILFFLGNIIRWHNCCHLSLWPIVHLELIVPPKNHNPFLDNHRKLLMVTLIGIVSLRLSGREGFATLTSPRNINKNIFQFISFQRLPHPNTKARLVRKWKLTLILFMLKLLRVLDFFETRIVYS